MKYILISLLILGSCKTPHSAANTKEAEVYLRISKTNCLGNCPVYDVWVTQDDVLRYSGIKGVAILGEHSEKLTKKEAKELKELVSQIDFEQAQSLIPRDKPKLIIEQGDKLLVRAARDYVPASQHLVDFLEKLVAEKFSTQ